MHLSLIPRKYVLSFIKKFRVLLSWFHNHGLPREYSAIDKLRLVFQSFYTTQI